MIASLIADRTPLLYLSVHLSLWYLVSVVVCIIVCETCEQVVSANKHAALAKTCSRSHSQSSYICARQQRVFRSTTPPQHTVQSKLLGTWLGLALGLGLGLELGFRMGMVAAVRPFAETQNNRTVGKQTLPN